MNEVKKDNTNASQVSESADVSMVVKLDETVTILKNIDEKLSDYQSNQGNQCQKLNSLHG